MISIASITALLFQHSAQFAVDHLCKHTMLTKTVPTAALREKMLYLIIVSTFQKRSILINLYQLPLLQLVELSHKVCIRLDAESRTGWFQYLRGTCWLAFHLFWGQGRLQAPTFPATSFGGGSAHFKKCSCPSALREIKQCTWPASNEGILFPKTSDALQYRLTWGFKVVDDWLIIYTCCEQSIRSSIHCLYHVPRAWTAY